MNVADLLLESGSVCVSSAKPGEKITVLSMQRSQGTPSYEGMMEISRDGEGFRIVNIVDLETYLKYVVPSEMPSDYPEEALKAQAVCARTYALKQIKEGRLSEYGADVDDTVAFQVYNNISRQQEADRAVDATKGMIMCSGGEPISSYFFSTSCGNTSTDEVWEAKMPAPYLKSVSVSGKTVEAMAAGNDGIRKDGLAEEEFRNYILYGDEQDYEKEEPWYRWSIVFPIEMLQEEVNRRWPRIGQLQELVIEERSCGGAAKKLAVKGSSGESRICTEYDIREFFSPKDQPITCKNGKKNTSMQILPSAYMIIDPVKEGEMLKGFAVHGGGYGHGVGMSQNGAKHLAKSGMEWKEILNLFYRNIEFVKMTEITE